jgi:hypothetical protein
MDEKQFKDRVSRLEKVATVLEKLPSEVRAAAFDLLREYVTKQASTAAVKPTSQKGATVSHDDDATFLGKFTHDKPADNARLIAANYYRKFGSEPFFVEDVRQCASDVGITIPNRVDNTLAAAMEKGKKLFARVGKSKFRPTVHGEAYLKTTYSVTKGTQHRPKAAE